MADIARRAVAGDVEPVCENGPGPHGYYDEAEGIYRCADGQPCEREREWGRVCGRDSIGPECERREMVLLKLRAEGRDVPA